MYEKPPYTITNEILRLVSSISVKIGEVNAKMLVKQNPRLRKQNQIKTIHASLAIEGNILSEEQITAIIEQKRVTGPVKDIKEVLNALSVYKSLHSLKYTKEKDFLKAHKMLMEGLVDKPGTYRVKGVGIVKGGKLKHMAPLHENVHYLMKNLFQYLSDKNELTLIKSCVFHYEMEFIHPFMDGNGRMGRFWQTNILTSEYPLFEFLPFETLIAKNQSNYYHALACSDKEGNSTAFMHFMLSIIDQALDELLENKVKKLTQTDRLVIFLETHISRFTRKDYMKYFPDISTATASRDLKNGVDSGLIEKTGDKKITVYKKAC